MRTAVILLNMGGPDSLDAVKPFLFNLFNDPAIIRAPTPIRWLIAKLISRKREPEAQAIYKELGGKSPLLENTQAQAAALEAVLNGNGEGSYKSFVAMRYWHPFASETVKEVKAWNPDQVVVLPLYPQYSTATNSSSIKDWETWAAKAGLTVPAKVICCFPTQDQFVAAHTNIIEKALNGLGDGAQPVHILFSAHGLPKKVVEAGDPYQWQVEQTSAAVWAELKKRQPDHHHKHTICYQSRVGPLEWIGPYTDEVIAEAGAKGERLLVVPIAFVSEHSETLVELGIEYKALALQKGVADYAVAPALGVEPSFIVGLADLVRQADDKKGVFCHVSGRYCPNRFSGCHCS